MVDKSPSAGTSATAVSRPNQKTSHAAQSRFRHATCSGALACAGLPHGRGKSTATPSRSEWISTLVSSATFTWTATEAVPSAGMGIVMSCHESRSDIETSPSIRAASRVPGPVANSGPIITSTGRPKTVALSSSLSKPVFVRYLSTPLTLSALKSSNADATLAPERSTSTARLSVWLMSRKSNANSMRVRAS